MLIARSINFQWEGKASCCQGRYCSVLLSQEMNDSFNSSCWAWAGPATPSHHSPSSLAQTHSMARVGIVDAALGSKQFLFEDHPSLLPDQGVGQAEVPLPALVLCLGVCVPGTRRGPGGTLGWSLASSAATSYYGLVRPVLSSCFSQVLCSGLLVDKLLNPF